MSQEPELSTAGQPNNAFPLETAPEELAADGVLPPDSAPCGKNAFGANQNRLPNRPSSPDSLPFPVGK